VLTNLKRKGGVAGGRELLLKIINTHPEELGVITAGGGESDLRGNLGSGEEVTQRGGRNELR